MMHFLSSKYMINLSIAYGTEEIVSQQNYAFFVFSLFFYKQFSTESHYLTGFVLKLNSYVM